MGTRNLTLVQKDGKYKVAQYGQWDGYPSGQGATALEFLQTANLKKFKKQVDKCVFTKGIKTAEKIFEKVNSLQPAGSYINPSELAKQHLSDKELFIYRTATRDTGAEILTVIYNAPESTKKIKLYDNSTFAEDSLFCEWAYVIDLDANTFEVYKGFNKDPLERTERFWSKNTPEKYYPVKLLKKYDLNDLPTMEEFLKLDEQD